MNNNNEIKIAGNMDHTLDHTFESANRIYDITGICPTIPTAQGGGITPKILEKNEPKLVGGLGEKNFGKQYRQGNRVYDSQSIAMCLNSQPVGNTGGNSYLYLVKEEKQMNDVSEVGFMDSGTGKHQSNTVYSEEGCSPTITTLQGGTQQIKICQKDNNSIKKVGQISNDGSQYGTVVDEKGLVSTLSAGTHGYANCCIHSKYRIRKLTPKECFRLMNFDDVDFNAAEEVNSNTQLYKQSGNSIVVSCLTAIFSQLNIQGIKPWNDRTEEEQYDLVNLQQESET
jgi:DNA (cytosine-5)-methyltransferase 1